MEPLDSVLFLRKGWFCLFYALFTGSQSAFPGGCQLKSLLSSFGLELHCWESVLPMYVGQGWARDLDKVDMPVLQLLLWFCPFFEWPFTLQLAVVVENSALCFELHGFLLSFSSSPWPSLGPAFKWWSLKRQQYVVLFPSYNSFSFWLLVVALWSLPMDCMMCPELGFNVSWRWYLLSVPFKSFFKFTLQLFTSVLSPSLLLLLLSPSLFPFLPL